MKSTIAVAVLAAAIVFVSTLLGMNFSDHLQAEKEKALLTTLPATTAASTESVTAEPLTEARKPQKAVVPEKLIVFTAEENTGTPVGSTAENPDITNSVFIGDSVSLGFSRYCAKKSLMNETVFLTAGSYSVHHALDSRTSSDKGFDHPMYKGKQTPVLAAIEEIKPANVYICLGINDVAVSGVEGTVKNYCKLINSIWEIDPEIHIYVVSTTFMVNDAQKTNLNNLNIANVNHNMKAVCENSEKLDYIDIMSALQDENYALAGQFCSDGFIHQENIAYDIWAEKLGAK